MPHCSAALVFPLRRLSHCRRPPSAGKNISSCGAAGGAAARGTSRRPERCSIQLATVSPALFPRSRRPLLRAQRILTRVLLPCVELAGPHGGRGTRRGQRSEKFFSRSEEPAARWSSPWKSLEYTATLWALGMSIVDERTEGPVSAA